VDNLKTRQELKEEQKTERNLSNLVTCPYCGNEWEEDSNQEMIKCPSCSVEVHNSHHLTSKTDKFCYNYICKKRAEGPTMKCDEHRHGQKTCVGVKRFKEDLEE